MPGILISEQIVVEAFHMPVRRCVISCISLLLLHIGANSLPVHLHDHKRIVTISMPVLHVQAATDNRTAKKERLMAYDELVLPHNTIPGDAIAAVSKTDFLTTWQPGMRVLVPHRGDVGLHGKHFFPDLSMAAIQRVFRTLGLMAVEVDITPVKDGEFVLAHERNGNRMTGFAFDWDNVTSAEVKNMRLGFRPVDNNGAFTNTVYSTNEEILSLTQFFDQILLPAHGANAIVDARDHLDPAGAIALLSHRLDLRDKAAIQVYNLAHNSANELIQEVEKMAPAGNWKETVMIIPVFRADGMHQVAGLDIINSNFSALAEAGFRWIDSWSAAGLRIPGYGLPVQGGFTLVDPATHRVNRMRFRRQFRRDPTPVDEVDLVKDHVLKVMLDERKRREPERFIVVPSCLPTTNAAGKLFRVRFRVPADKAEAMDQLDPQGDVKDWMYMEAAMAGAAFRNGGDVCITDQTIREISYQAFVDAELEAPGDLFDPMYPPFSQRKLLEFLKQTRVD